MKTIGHTNTGYLVELNEAELQALMRLARSAGNNDIPSSDMWAGSFSVNTEISSYVDAINAYAECVWDLDRTIKVLQGLRQQFVRVAAEEKTDDH